LQNTTSIRRKAQQLAQKGAYGDAMAEYAKLAEQGHLEPYDLVVYGDLLARNGSKGEAVERYLEAMDSYASAGLNRNAIALGKKVRRLAPHHMAVPRKLAELYASEGLASESCLHYLEFLESVDGKDPGAADSVEEACRKLLDLSLPSFQVVKQIVGAAKAYGREKALAPGVLHQSRRAKALKNTEAEKSLLEMARSLDPTVEQGPAHAGPPAADDTPQYTVDPSEIDLGPTPAAETAEPAPADEPEEPAVLSLDDFAFDETMGAGASPADAPSLESGDLLLDGANNGDGTHDEGVDASEPVSEDGITQALDPDELRARGLGFLERNDTTRAQRAFIRAAALYFEAARSKDAADLYERVVKMDPNHLEALRGLVEIAHINGEKGKMAHWGCELGDVLLAREMYPEAKVQFERVLAFDSRNAKALSRLKRLNTIAGVQSAGYGSLTATPAASEIGGAQVSVRDDENHSSQSTLNLSQILEEFRAAVVERIPSSDGQSHYDLGMTYKEMGLFDEAIREFEVAASSEENRLAAQEMTGECYLLLSRPADALKVFETVAALGDQATRAQAHLRMGEALEGLGEWSRAEEEYYRALELNEGLEEAIERLGSMEERRERGAA
jgi:tetratricopeptide (TPR) repeat protein